MISIDATYRVNFVLAIGHFAAVIAVLITLFMNDGGWAIPVELTYNTWNEVGDNFVIQTTSDRVAEKFYPGYALVTCSIFSGFHHAVAAKYVTRYYAQIQTGFSGYRWVDYAFSASMMVIANEVLWYAPPDINDLMLTGFVQMFMVLAGGVAVESWWASGRGPPYDRGDNTDPESSMHYWILFHFCAAFVAFMWMWSRYFIILSLGASETGNVPLFVYVILILLFVSFLAFPAIFLFKITGDRTDKARNVKYEASFWLASALAKIPLLTFFATGIIARRNRVGVDSDIPDDEDSQEGIYTASAAAALVVLIVGYILKTDTGQAKPRTVKNLASRETLL